MKKAASNRKMIHQQIGLQFKKKLAKCYIWSIALYDAEIWTLPKIDHKYSGSFKLWCWRRME
jgi:hypothetical protein